MNLAHAGWNRWAEVNRIVAFYPEAIPSPGNPNGCWDWWGYTGADYNTRSGAQMAALKAMIDHLTRRP